MLFFDFQYCSTFTLFLGHTFSTQIDDKEQGEDDDEHQRREGTEFGRQTTLAGIGIDVGAERLQTNVALREEADGKIIDGEREGEYEAADDARFDFGDDDLGECLEGRGAKIKGSFVDVGIHSR